MTVAQRRAAYSRIHGKKKNKVMREIVTDRPIKQAKGGAKIKGGGK